MRAANSRPNSRHAKSPDRSSKTRERGILARMGILIGMDEAGYGPHLGPLVVAASAWYVPDEIWNAAPPAVSAPSKRRKRASLKHQQMRTNPSQPRCSIRNPQLAIRNLGSTFTACCETLFPKPPAIDESPSLIRKFCIRQARGFAISSAVCTPCCCRCNNHSPRGRKSCNTAVPTRMDITPAPAGRMATTARYPSMRPAMNWRG